MKFVKAHTNGNDFIIINCSPLDFYLSRIVEICDRRKGIGCDQLIFVHQDTECYRVAYFNSDGTYANMCGNGTCAIGKYIREVLQDSSPKFLISINDTNYEVTVDEGEVSVCFAKPQMLGEVICTGNKHLVRNMFEVKNAKEIQKRYPECNIHFARILGDNKIRVKTFERGVGWTLACGSGAVAVAFHSKLPGKIEIIHDGGKSYVEVLENSVKFTASPTLVYEGEIYG